MPDTEDKKLEEPQDLKGRTEVTGREKIRELREIVKPPGRKGVWLQKLNDRQLAEVYQRLRMGQSAHMIVRICQNDWKVMRNSTIDSMARAVVAFRKKALPELKGWAKKMSEEQKRQSHQWQTRAKKMKKSFDAVAAMIWLASIQWERMVELREREKQVRLPMKQTDRAGKEFRETLKELLNVQIRLGILESKPEELHLLVKQKFDGMMQVIKDSSGGSQAMLTATRQLMEGLEEEAITLKVNEDGAYSVGGDSDGPEDSSAGEGDPESGDSSEE